MVSRALTPELAERVGRLSDEVLVLVLDAFRASRRAEAERLAAELLAYVDALLDEMERTADAVSPAVAERIEAAYREAGSSPAVAAHFGHAADVLIRLRAHPPARRGLGREGDGERAVRAAPHMTGRYEVVDRMHSGTAAELFRVREAGDPAGTLYCRDALLPQADPAGRRRQRRLRAAL